MLFRLDFPYPRVPKSATYARIDSRLGAGWRNPMGEKMREALKLRSDKRLRLEFQGARITSDAGLPA